MGAPTRTGGIGLVQALLGFAVTKPLGPVMGAAHEGGFRRSALLMLAGTAGAQGLTLLIMPVLTRMYPTDAIGVQAVFVSIAALLVVLATLRLDLALVLPRDEDRALRLVGLIFYQAIAVAAVVLLVATFLSGALSRSFAPEISSGLWIWLLPPMLVAGAMTQSGIGMATRRGRFGAIVSNNLVLSATFASSALLIGVIHPFDQGIVIARLLGQMASAALLAVLGLVAIRRALGSGPLSSARSQWHKERQFVIFNTPYSLISGFARDFPIFVFSLSGGVALVASYALARTVTLAPTTLISASLSNVFYREASLHLGTPRLQRLASSLTRWGLFSSLPAFALLFVWGDQLFVFAFGSSWHMAGEFAQRLSIPLWLALQAGWPERLFEASRKQHVSFKIQIWFDALHAIVLFGAFTITNDAMLAVTLFAVSSSAYQVTYLVAVYRVARFEVASLARTLATAFALFGLDAGALLLARGLLPLSQAVALAAAGGATVAVTLIVLASLYAKNARLPGSVK